MRISSSRFCGAAALVVTVCLAVPARASFHLWQIVEVYSNSSGTVQFIEMLDQSFGENHVGGQSMRSNANTFSVPADFADPNTVNRRLLFATPGYFALSGVPAADYNLGVNNFFNTSGDTLNWAFVNTFTFGSGQLPTNGVTSLNRAYNGSAITQATNSPTNFAGQTGSIPEPGMALTGGVGVLVCLRRSTKS
jgi:hypothetical protein